MINLLPPQLKQNYRSGRLNRHLSHWIIACAIGIVGALCITVFGYLYLDQTTKNYTNQTANLRTQLTAQNLKGVQEEVKEISNNLDLVVDVLSKQILFSELLSQLTKLLPSNTRLSGLSISQGQDGIDISASAANYQAATQLHTNIADTSNKLFSKADIISISCADTTASHPCTVTIRALFAPNSSYMFTTNTSGAKS